MPKLGLGFKRSASKSSMITPGIVTDNLVLKHNYNAGSVMPVSDGAVKFNGTTDYIATGAKPVDTANATYCFWAKSDETGENAGAFGHEDDKTGAFNVNHSTTGKPLLYLASTHYQYWEVTHEADDGKWHHWAVVVDIATAGNSKLYIDGALQTQDSGSEGTALSYGNLEIGRSDTTFEYEGYMCNFGVWTGHLTQPQIKSIMNKNYAGLTTSEKTNLVSWWNLDEGITTDGSVTFALDNHTTTLTTVPNQTWAVQSGSPTVNGQEITFTAGESQQVGCTLSTGAGNYKVNMTVSDYSGSGTISLLWDGGGSSDLRTTGNGTFEWVTYLDSSPNILKDSGAAGKVTVNSIKKYDGNTGELK